MEAIGTLAGGIAHDFNNILSPVSGYTELLLMDKQEDTTEKKYLEVILGCVKHAKELVNQILTFSRQKEHMLNRLNAPVAVQESMTLIRSSLPSTIRLNVCIDNTCGYVMADSVQIHQVLLNLVTNAHDAMEDTGGTIDISLSKVKPGDAVFSRMAGKGNQWLCLSVKDTGPGIDPDIQDRIFDPYFSTKKEGKGSGIGLSIVEGIVQGHGGCILVESSREKGTCFKVYLPECTEQTANREPFPVNQPIQTGSERILLVDDDKKVAVMETHMLEKIGYKVTCFTGSPNAIKAFKQTPHLFDLVVTDMTMPDLSGLQIAEQVYQVRPEVPVILCTGFGDTLHMHGQKKDVPNIKGILKKPVAIKELAYVLRKALDQH
jgi:CheY-like chemotaxis protein